MIRQTPYEPGTPSYADLASPDLDASRAFYGALFGWTGEASTVPEAMGYTVFMLGDAAVAGLGPTFGDMPPHWNTYVTVADVDEAVATAAAAGGQVMAEPFDVFDAGRMATIKDPTGAVVSLWQPRGSIGAQIRAEHGAFCWAEVLTADPAAAAGFLAALLDVRTETAPMPDGVQYTVVMAGDIPVAGVMKMPEHLLEMRHPAHWSTYMQVDDTDAAVAAAEAGGGSVLMPAADIATVGRIAVIADPQRAALGLMTPEQ